LFLDLKHVHKLHETGGSDFRVKVELSLDAAFSLLRAEERRTEPINAAWAMGRSRPADFLWTTLGVPIIVSQNVVSLLKAGGFRGWTTAPLILCGKNGEHIPGYRFLMISGRCGVLQPERSEEVMVERPGGHLVTMYKGTYFDETKWDGSHIFMPSNPCGLVFVLDEVRKAMVDAGIKGVMFTPTVSHLRAIR
jgi:hypothetical protein